MVLLMLPMIQFQQFVQPRAVNLEDTGGESLQLPQHAVNYVLLLAKLSVKITTLIIHFAVNLPALRGNLWHSICENLA